MEREMFIYGSNSEQTARTGYLSCPRLFPHILPWPESQLLTWFTLQGMWRNSDAMNNMKMKKNNVWILASACFRQPS